MDNKPIYRITKVKRKEGRPYNRYHSWVMMQECVVKSIEPGKMAIFMLRGEDGKFSKWFHTSMVEYILTKDESKISFVTSNTEYELTRVGDSILDERMD